MNEYGEKLNVRTGAISFLPRPNHILFFAACFVVVLFLFGAATDGITMETKKKIVLLGASVGKKWAISDLPKRLGSDAFVFNYVGVYKFDKTEQLAELLREEDKPAAIFLKECAAYFPGDLDHYKELMKSWIQACRNSEVIPIPTTVVPVVRDRSIKTRIKDFIKKFLGRPLSTARLNQLLAYNDWIRSYAAQNGLVVLDLEKTLRINETNRSLRSDLHSGDGLHLNNKAYHLLDGIVIQTLKQADL